MSDDTLQHSLVVAFFLELIALGTSLVVVGVIIIEYKEKNAFIRSNRWVRPFR